MAADVLRSLIVTISANTGGFVKGLTAAERKLGKWARQVGAMGRSLTQSITVPLAAIGAGATKMATDFEDSFARMEGLAGVGAEEVAGLREEVLQLAGKTGKAPGELAEGLNKIRSAGFAGQEALDVLRTSAKGSVAGLGDVSDIADTLTGVIEAYGHGNISAARAANILTGAVKEGKADADQFAPALSKVIGVAAQVGIGFDEVAGAVAAMTRLNFTASEGATGLANVIKGLVNPTETAQKALASVGLSADGIRQMIREKGLLATLEALKKAFGGNVVELRRVFTDFDGLRTVMSLLGENVETTRGIFHSLAGETSFLDEAFRARATKALFQFGRATTAVSVAMIRLGTEILPIVTPWIDKLADVVTRVSTAFGELPQSQRRSIIMFGGLVAAIGPALIAFAGLIKAFAVILGLGGPLVKAAIGIVTVLRWMGGMTGLGLVIIAINLLVLNWDDAWKAITKVTEASREKLGPVFTWLSKQANDVASGLRTLAIRAMDETGDAAKTAGEKTAAAMGTAQDAATAATPAVRDYVSEYKDVIKLGSQTVDTQGLEGQSRAIRDVAAAAQEASSQVGVLRSDFSPGIPEDVAAAMASMETLKIAYPSMLAEAAASGKEQLDLIRSDWHSFAASVTSVLAEAFDSTFMRLREEGGNVFRELAQGFKRFAIMIIDVLAQQLIAAKVAGVAAAIANAPLTFGASLAKIPAIFAAVAPALVTLSGIKAGLQKLAEGGLVSSPGAFLVGERGPEIVSLPRGSAVSPMSGRTEQTIINVIDGREISRQVVRNFPRLVELHVGR